MSVATTTTVEWLRFTPENPRGRVFFEALLAAATATDVECVSTDTYRGTSDLLMLWGPGHPARFEPMRQQIANGGHVIAADLSYWQRDTKVRISFDAAHPQRWVMRKALPSSRFEADSVPIGDHWKPTGPILFAGIGDKAKTQYGSVVAEWEAQMIARCQSYGRSIWYRPKTNAVIPDGAMRAPSGHIDDVLRGCSLVVTWHSNVAVDAIRMGIPVVCKDGAAAAICPSEPEPTQQPMSPEWRARFLSNLAWYQWAPSEAESCLRFVLEMLS